MYKSLLMLALLAIVACAPKVRSTSFVPGLPPTSEAEPIRVYQTTLPDCDYEEIGTITVQQRNKYQDVQVSLEAMQKRAREMGGHAIINFKQGEETTGGAVVGMGVVAVRKAHLSGTVIRFTDPECRE